jgi:hypothetical protein
MAEVFDEQHDAPASSATNRPELVKALLERSSLGTPGARSLRARTDPEVVLSVLRRVRGRRTAEIPHVP